MICTLYITKPNASYYIIMNELKYVLLVEYTSKQISIHRISVLLSIFAESKAFLNVFIYWLCYLKMFKNEMKNYEIYKYYPQKKSI